MTIALISVRKRRGRVLHAVSEGSVSPRETLCGLIADAMIIDGPDPAHPTCKHCLYRLAKDYA